jgi:hypothetical protein
MAYEQIQPDETWQCPYCSRTFSRFGNGLRPHIVFYHKDKYPEFRDAYVGNSIAKADSRKKLIVKGKPVQKPAQTTSASGMEQINFDGDGETPPSMIRRQIVERESYSPRSQQMRVPPPVDESLFETPDETPTEEVMDERENLRRVLNQAGILKKADLIISNMAQRGNYSDLKTMNWLLTLGGYPVSNRALAIDTWAKHLRIPIPEDLKTDLNLTAEETEGDMLPPRAQVPKPSKQSPVDDWKEQLDAMMAENIKHAQQQLQLVQLGKQLQNLGLDPSEFGIPMPQKKSEPEAIQAPPQPKLKRFEFPPDSGVFLEMTDSEYAEKIISYRRLQLQKEAVEKPINKSDESMTDYEFPPGSGIHIKMTPMAYATAYASWSATQKATSETSQYEKMLNEQKTSYETMLNEQKKHIDDLQAKIQNDKDAKLQGALDALTQNYSTIEQKYKETLSMLSPENLATRLAMAKEEAKRAYGLSEVREATPEEKIALSKSQVASEATAKVMDVGAKKIDKMGSGKDAVIKALSPVIPDLAKKAANRFMGESAPAVNQDMSEQDVEEVNRILSDALHEEATEQGGES